ncbi:MAG: cation:proton antiporter [Chlorobi bacterium]|nr:cation:proton antiporter [Chlorobiota bacterium]
MELIALIVAFVLGFVMRLLGLPPMLGFLIAGFVLNFFGVSSSETIDKVGDMGILLLLFTVGLKLNVKSLITGHVWKGGLLQMLLNFLIFGLIFMLLGYLGMFFFTGMPLKVIALISFALAFSSTVFAVKVLEDTGEMTGIQGKTAIAILIIQDVLAVLFLAISEDKTPSVWALLLLGLPFLRKPTIWLMKKSGHGEMMILFGFLLAFWGAELFSMVGLKPALGALVAGMILANSPKSNEMAKSLMNFKEFFLIAFFLSIGLSGTPEWWMIGIAFILILMLPIKGFLYFRILTFLGLRARTSFQVATGLLNYSEFALIVASVAVAQNMLSNDWLIVISIAVSLSFIVAAPVKTYLDFTVIEKYLTRFEKPKPNEEDKPINISGCKILVFGMGKIGTKIYDELAAAFDNKVMGLDDNYDTVLNHKKAGRNVITGDATDSQFWETLQPGQVTLVLLTLSNHSANLFAATTVKKHQPDIKVAALAQYDDEMEELGKAGVDKVVNLYEEAGAGFAGHALTLLEDKTPEL